MTGLSMKTLFNPFSLSLVRQAQRDHEINLNKEYLNLLKRKELHPKNDSYIPEISIAL